MGHIAKKRTPQLQTKIEDVINPLLFTIPFALVSILISTIFTSAAGTSTPRIQSFSDIYEPSAVIQINSTTVFIAEDEGDRPLLRATITENKGILTLVPDRLPQLPVKVDDLEAVTMGKGGQIFLITSHTARKNGKHKKKRQRLLQLTLKNNTISSLTHTDTLLKDIRQYLQKSSSLNQIALATINIEGLTFDPLQKNLLIGLRAPLHNKKSIALILKNPYALKDGKQPVFADTPIFLDMQGSGIRAMAYNHDLNLYILAGEIKNKKGKLRPKLWAWDGIPGHQPSKIRLPKLKGIKNIEGITPLHFNGSNYLLLVCDDGNKDDNKGAHYIILNSRTLPPGSNKR